MKILVSCCDNGSGLFMCEDGEWTHLVDTHAQSVLRTPLGIMLMTEGWILLYDEERLKKKELSVITRTKFALRGHHGSVWDDQTGLVATVSSDENTIYWTCPISGEKKRTLEVNRPGSHTNDIDIDGSEIYVSSFHRGITRVDRETGSRQELWVGEEKAHSVKKVNGEVWWCESDQRRVKRNGKIVSEFPGFPRGLEWYNGDLIVGISRHKYREEGHAGFYYNDSFYSVPNGVTNVYDLLVLE